MYVKKVAPGPEGGTSWNIWVLCGSLKPAELEMILASWPRVTLLFGRKQGLPDEQPALYPLMMPRHERQHTDGILIPPAQDKSNPGERPLL